IFNDLTAPPTHGVAVADTANGAAVTAARRFLGRLGMPATATAADSDKAARLVADVMNFRNDTAKTKAAIDSLKAMGLNLRVPGGGARGGPSQCHDITVYPSAGFAAGACSGYGLLLNIKDPTHPVRLQAVADSNFSFWHSATFSNDASKLLFTDEWGGGTDGTGKLRRAQRQPGAGAGSRHHGAGLVSGRRVGVRLHRPRTPQGDRLLRSRSDRLDQARVRRLLGRLLLQRLHLWFGDRARSRCVQAHADRRSDAERDRRRETGALRPA